MVLGKFSTMFSPDTDFACPRIPGGAGPSSSQTVPEAWAPWLFRSHVPDDRIIRDFIWEGKEIDGGSSEP